MKVPGGAGGSCGGEGGDGGDGGGGEGGGGDGGGLGGSGGEGGLLSGGEVVERPNIVTRVTGKGNRRGRRRRRRASSEAEGGEGGEHTRIWSILPPKFPIEAIRMVLLPSVSVAETVDVRVHVDQSPEAGKATSWRLSPLTLS